MRKENVKKHRINFIDIVVILLVVICVSSVVARAVVVDMTKDEYEIQEYQVYFEIEDIKQSSYSYFIEGDTVRLKSSNQILGVLGSDFRCIPLSEAYNVNEDEKEEENDSSNSTNNLIYTNERCSVSGNIIVQGIFINDKFLINGTIPLAVGDTREIITEHIQVNIKITNIIEK